MKAAYLQAGEGHDLVMLHGYLSSKESFRPQFEYFSRFYRVTAPDFPGMGAADALTEAWSVDDYARWTEEFFTSLGIRFPLLMAHSFGGRVGLKLLARGEIDRAVLIGCAGVVPEHGPLYRARVRAYRLVKKIAPRFAEAHFGSSDYRALSPVMKESFKKIVGEDLRETAATISRPVLFLNGACDSETPVAQVEKLHACVRDSRLTVLDGCGHFAHLERPLEATLAAEEFYRNDT